MHSLRLGELFLESIRILERRIELSACGPEVSDGEGPPRPLPSPVRAIGP